VSVPPMGLSRVRDAESVAMLAPARGDAEGLILKVALLECELVEARRARDVAGERVCRLLNSSSEGARWLMTSEMYHQEQFGDLSLLRTMGIELCLSIIGPS
jgi:hypothetical protein